MFLFRGGIFSGESNDYLPGIRINKWNSVSDKMAFCLCLVVISTIFSAVQGRSGPINGTREALNSPCQSIYSFQKLNFETLKNSREQTHL